MLRSIFFILIISLTPLLAISNYRPYDNTMAKNEISCDNINRDGLMVILTFGQSNASNHGKGRYKTTSKHVFTLFEDKCYVTTDPILGGTGSSGSVWGRFSNKFIENGFYKNVLIRNIGVGESLSGDGVH